MPPRRALPLALLLLAPLASAQAPVGGPAPPPGDTGYAGGPVTVPLYGHIYDLLQPVPMNTQPMIDLDLARGFGSPSVTGAGPLATPQSLRFYSSPGLVEYNETQDGLPRHHPERGISFDVLLDPSQNVVGHWFMGVKALDAPQAGQTGGPESGLAPALTVRMTMRVGDNIGADLDAGEVIARGQATLDPSKWPVSGEPVEFVVDMGAPLLDRIPGDVSFNVLVEWFNAETPDGSHRLTQRDWILHTGERYPNRVEVGVLNPLAIYSVRPTPVGHDRITLHAEMNSPFGNYDVDTSTVELLVEGPTTPKTIAAPFVVQKSYEHNHHYEPVTVTWVWDYRAENAAPGEYKVTVTAKNLQGTATATKSATFVIPENGRAVGYSDTGDVVAAADAEAPAETPGPALMVLLGALALVAVLRRR